MIFCRERVGASQRLFPDVQRTKQILVRDTVRKAIQKRQLLVRVNQELPHFSVYFYVRLPLLCDFSCFIITTKTHKSDCSCVLQVLLWPLKITKSCLPLEGKVSAKLTDEVENRNE